MNDLPDLTTDPHALRVIKRPINVPVKFAIQDGICKTLEGPVTVRAGDAVLTGVQGEQWPVQRHLFLASYTPEPPTQPGQDGIYRKNPTIALAIRLDRPVAVPVGWQSDNLQGHPGDWLIRYADGSHGVMQHEVFQQTYRSADREDEPLPPAER